MKLDQQSADSLSQSVSALKSEMEDLGTLADTFGNKLVSSFASAKGNAFSSGSVLPFADGGVVNSPTLFGMNGGLGLMGEARPDAVMHLARGPDGSLGVKG